MKASTNCYLPNDTKYGPSPLAHGEGTAVTDFTSADVLAGLKNNAGAGVEWVAGIGHPTFVWDDNNILADYTAVEAAIARATALDMQTLWHGRWRTASQTALVMACSGRTIAAPAHKSLLSFSEPITASKNPSGRESLLRLPAFLCISWSMIAINYEHISMRTFLNPQNTRACQSR